MSHLHENNTLPTVEAESPSASRSLPEFDSGASGQRCPACCGTLRKLVTPVLVVVTVMSICAAAYFAGRSSTLQGGQKFQVPLIEAASAVTSDKYSIATGAVSEDADGLFVLDHNSGLLQCSVIYPRMAKFMATFQINVAEAVGSGAKGGNYMMLTGRASFPRASNRPAASTVVYVMDTTTGNYACYGIPFDNVAKNANRPQQGLLVLISTGSANPVIDRDNLR